MGKRSAFKRRALDTYDTPEAAVAPLLGHLPSWCRFWEPCAGQLDLVNHLESHGLECVVASDIEPRDERVFRLDALATTRSDVDCTGATHIITNPAWSRFILHPMILHFSAMRPTWLLFDADWVHTRQAAPYLPHLRKIVSVGRVKWIEGSKNTGKDNCAWHLFTAEDHGRTEFIGRAA